MGYENTGAKQSKNCCSCLDHRTHPYACPCPYCQLDTRPSVSGRFRRFVKMVSSARGREAGGSGSRVGFPRSAACRGMKRAQARGIEPVRSAALRRKARVSSRSYDETASFSAAQLRSPTRSDPARCFPSGGVFPDPVTYVLWRDRWPGNRQFLRGRSRRHSLLSATPKTVESGVRRRSSRRPYVLRPGVSPRVRVGCRCPARKTP